MCVGRGERGSHGAIFGVFSPPSPILHLRFFFNFPPLHPPHPWKFSDNFLMTPFGGLLFSCRCSFSAFGRPLGETSAAQIVMPVSSTCGFTR